MIAQNQNSNYRRSSVEERFDLANIFLLVFFKEVCEEMPFATVFPFRSSYESILLSSWTARIEVNRVVWFEKSRIVPSICYCHPCDRMTRLSHLAHQIPGLSISDGKSRSFNSLDQVHIVHKIYPYHFYGRQMVQKMNREMVYFDF